MEESVKNIAREINEMFHLQYKIIKDEIVDIIIEKDTIEEKIFALQEQKKALIARSLCQQAHLYLWDEPLNYVDVLSRMQIERLITQFRPAMILVEHDAAFLRNVHARQIDLDKWDEAYYNGFVDF